MKAEDKKYHKSTLKSQRSKPKASNLNDANCGLTPTFDDGDRIVGGEQAKPFQYPWNVALTLQRGLQFCGGSLINKWASIFIFSHFHMGSISTVIRTILYLVTICL